MSAAAPLGESAQEPRGPVEIPVLLQRGADMLHEPGGLHGTGQDLARQGIDPLAGPPVACGSPIGGAHQFAAGLGAVVTALDQRGGGHHERPDQGRQADGVRDLRLDVHDPDLQGGEPGVGSYVPEGVPASNIASDSCRAAVSRS